MTSTIRMTVLGPKVPSPSIGSESIHYGVAVRGSAGAIIRVKKTTNGNRFIGQQLVTGITRLPYDVAIVVRSLREIRETDAMSRITIDRDQLGGAVWASLGTGDGSIASGAATRRPDPSGSS